MKKILLILPLILGASVQAMQPDIFDAVKTGNLEVVKNLIDQGADVNQTEKGGWTPLHWAALLDYLPIAQFLLERGALINQVDQDGWTALMYTNTNNPYTVQQLLIEHGASACLVNKRGHTVLTLVAKRDRQPELLINHLMKIPNKAQTKNICTFLLCMKQLNMPKDLPKYILPKHLLAVIEAENREKSDGSVALREINKIKDEDMKTKLIAKFWPGKEENAL